MDSKNFSCLNFKNAIGDLSFKTGFKARRKLNNPSNPPLSFTFKNYIKPYKVNKFSEPRWEISQWMSQSVIDSDSKKGKHIKVSKDLSFTLSDPNKFKTIAYNRKDKSLLLECNCSKEYSGDTQEFNEFYNNYWWVHLLLQQSLPKPIFLSKHKKVIFNAEYTILKADLKGNGVEHSIAPCGQSEWYVCIQNMNKNSKEFNKYQWFGFELYDTRHEHEITQEYKDGEYGSGVRTTRPSSKEYLKGDVKPAVNEKTELFYDGIIKYIKEDFKANHGEGKYWGEETKFEDLAIASMNIGFEIHDHHDMSMVVRHLGIFYK